MFRNILTTVAVFALVVAFMLSSCNRKADKRTPRVVGIGIDGMDATLVEKLLAEGKLPNLAALAAAGTYTRLQTTNPAESPVAWAAFATGSNPGKTGLFGFLERDPQTYLPAYAPTSFIGGKSFFNLLPLKKPRYVNNRKQTSFWEIASKLGIRSTILRCPVAFPPEPIRGAILAGMEVPDIRGTTGTFAFYTSEQLLSNYDEKVIPLQFKNGKARTFVRGPNNWIKGKQEPVQVPLALELVDDPPGLRITLAGQRRVIERGQWSPWFEIEFSMGFMTKVRGIARFYLQSLSPEVKLYLSPINIDPRHPVYPISTPTDFAADLVDAVGLYKTLGWDIDSWALNEGFLDEKAILQDAYQTLRQQEAMALHLLKNSPSDLFITVFGALDRIQHIFWRYIDEQHPLYESRAPEEIRNAISNFYTELDRIVGNLYAQLDSQAVFMVFSDHGCSSFRRRVNLNTWLLNNNYLALQTHTGEALPEGKFFQGVDWRRTRAYGLGIGGLYLNVAGRERQGHVQQAVDYEKVKQDIIQKLLQLSDEETGAKVVRNVYEREKIYSGPYVAKAPDLLVGLNAGYRVSQTSSLGGLEKEIISDNVRKWSGDHVSVDPALVPGVLFVNRKMALLQEPSIIDIAPTILGLLGVEKPAAMDGHNLLPDRKLPLLTGKVGNRPSRKSDKAVKNSRANVLLIGLDGADWKHIELLVRQGQLPHFARLMQLGAYGNLHSSKPLLSPMIWTTIATGKEPSEHEIFDFLVTDERNGQQIPVTSNLRKTRAIWNILSKQQKSVGVVGWLVTWPAEKINGIMISDRLAYLDFAPGPAGSPPGHALTFPDVLFEEIRPLLISPRALPYEKISPLLSISKAEYRQALAKKSNPIWSATAVVAATETYSRIARYLQKQRAFDLFAVYFKGIDSFSHLFAPISKRATGTANPGASGKYENAIANFYIYQDQILGDLLAATDESTTVVIVSDHGFKLPGQAATHTAEIGTGNAVDWHTDKGIILLSGNNINKNVKLFGASTLDIAPTILYLLGLPVAADMPGRLLTEAISPSYLSAHPIKKIDSYEKSPLSSERPEVLASNEDPALKATLQALGYLNPETANSYNSKGNFYLQQGKYARAMAAFQKAIELQPEVAAFHDNLGNVYTAMGQPEKAIAEHYRAIALNPSSYKAYNNLGLAYLELGKYAEARKVFKKAISLNPEFADAYSNLGNLYYLEGNIKKAETLIRKSLQLDPDLARSHYNLGVMYGEKGLPMRAIAEFREVLRIDPNYPQRAHVHNGLGVAYFNLKQFDEALAEFQKALELDSTFSGIYSRIGLVNLSIGNIQAAEKAFQKSLELEPENLMIRQMLDEIHKMKTKNR